MAASNVKLSKDSSLKLTKLISYTKDAYFALTWNTNRYKGKRDFDLDLSMFCLDEDGICQDERYFVWFRHKIAPGNVLAHSGDNRVGVSGDGDAEVIKIKLDKMPAWVKSIVAVVTIFEHGDDQHFGLVDNAFVRIMDHNKEEKLRFALSEEAHVSENVGMVFGQLNRISDDEWEFKATEEGSDYGLEEYIEQYGLNLREIFNKYCR